MPGFSIDDVRDTLSRDISRFLEHIEKTATGLAEPQPPLRKDDISGAQPAFQSIGDAGHAIYGTSALVSVESLASSAKLLERLAERGNSELATAARHAEQARRIADALRDGATQMRVMLNLELEHRDEDAQWTALEWQDRARPLLDVAAEVEAVAKASLRPVPLPSKVAAPLLDEETALGEEPEVADDLEFSFTDESAAEEPEVKEAVAAAPAQAEEEEFSFDAPSAVEGAAFGETREEPEPSFAFGDDGDGVTVVEPARQAEPEAEFAFGDGPADEQLPSFSFGEGEEAEDASALAPEAEGAGERVSEAEFNFEATDESAHAAAVDPLHDELRAIFQQEVQENLVALQGYLESLYATHDDLGAARALERVYHTLKGAAATVGLEDVSQAAYHLQERMSAVVENGAQVTPELLDTLVVETTVMMRLAGFADLQLNVNKSGEPRRPYPLAGAEEARNAFIAEARDLLDLASRRVAELDGGDTVDAEDARRELVRLFHRLKGSALVVEQRAIAAEAERLEKLCDLTMPSTAELSRGIAQIASFGVPAEAPAASARGSVRAEDERAQAFDDAEARREMRAAFVDETRRILREANNLAGMIDASASAGADYDSLQELGRLMHRLKGSALVVGEEAISNEAATLQRLCEGENNTAGVAAAPTRKELKDGLARIAEVLGGDVSRSEAESFAVTRQSISAPDPELWQAFSQECTELLETLDGAILSLEESENPRESLTALLPTYHTLKGVVNTIGLGPTGKILHRVEDFIEALRAAAVLPSMTAVATFLMQVQVEVRKNLKQAKRGYVEASLAKVEAQIERVLSGRRFKAQSVRSNDSRASSAMAESQSASAHDFADDPMARRFVRVSTDRLDSLMNLAGELVVSRSRLLARVDALRTLQAELGRGGRRLVETVERFVEEHEFALLDGRSLAARNTLALAAGAEHMSAPAFLTAMVPASGLAGVGGGDAPRNDAWSGFTDLELDRYEDVHVLSRTLAELTSDFGEMYSQLATGLAALTDDSDAFGGIVSGIQSEVTRSRMVPLEALFSRLRLPIRDAAIREDKEVRVVTRGEGVQLDKTIADALFQPMLHLVRNAVAHGIERSAVREAGGKAHVGIIELVARQELGQIVLEVRDDGAGLNLPRLRQRGIEMGLIEESVLADDPTVADLVFAAGLSTEATARAVAGRGVGCDFVRRQVERLNGSIRVSSTKSRGTTFTLTLPITLAITKALLVRQGGQTFAIPLYFAERILDAQEQVVVESAGVRRVKIDDAYVGVTNLASHFGREGAEVGPIVVLRVGSERTILQVDAVVGQEEIVVKGLGAVLTGHPLFAGVTLRGNGEMVLILDVPGLAESRQAGHERRAARRREAVSELPPPPAPEVTEAAAPESQPRPKAKAPPLAVRTDADARRLRVMFVDDSLSVRKVAEKTLNELGVDVTVAVDGLDALAKLRETSFDVLFTDLEMPRMHGFELIRELRFLTAYQDLPIIVVTSRSGQKHQQQARALGATEYLTKPFTPQALEAALQKFGRVRRGGKA